MKRFFITALLVIPLTVALVLFSNDSDKGAHAEAEKIIFSGIDLSCENCKNEVELSLENLLGIEEYSLNPSEETVTVWYDQEQIQADWIFKALEAAGFPPEEMNK